MTENLQPAESTAALTIHGLNKTMGKKQILHDISFETQKGEVFGFLGPNGAGKTTTIKMIVGLLSIDSGEILIDGKSLQKNFETAIGSIGAIVENPEMYKHLTGMQNIRQYARIRTMPDGSPIPQTRIDEVVALVGLSKRINEKISKYSLGMRQRLGVAQALLHHPKLLILDEPTNGLDPAGIKELRDILKGLAHEENISVLVSSHLMSEMELMCDRVGIIVEGKMLSVQTVEEMVAASNTSTSDYVLHVSEPEKATELIREKGFDSVKLAEDGRLELILPRETALEQIADLNEAIVTAKIRLYTVALKENKRLEDVFIAMTNTGGDQIA